MGEEVGCLTAKLPFTVFIQGDVVSLFRRSLLAAVVLSAVLVPIASAQVAPPSTGFEDNDGAAWTTHEEELAFLEAVDAGSERVKIDVVGTTAEGRPLHLVQIGFPTPKSVGEAREGVVELHICSQHGNEPAGREACLQQIRNLAFTDDPAITAALSSMTVLFIPAANPDGRAADTRANSLGTDLNRNHLEITELETIAMGEVVRDWRPDLNLDHHEYGPATPALYDDDLLYLWPRNLNVDDAVHDAAKSFAVDVLNPCAAAAGYSSDEYGLQAAGDLDLQQTAGDEDDGISRNAAGLRHGLGILVESAVTQDPGRPGEIQANENMKRRVASQVSVIDCALDFMAEQGPAISAITDASRANAIVEGRDRTEPTFFDGQDEDTTITGGEESSTSFQDPPFCGFRIGADLQSSEVTTTLQVHGITAVADGPDQFVTMAQEAEPVIGLLLDDRGSRKLISAEGLGDCSAFAAPTPVSSPTSAPAASSTPTPAPATPTPAPAPAASPTTTSAPTPGGGLPATGGGAALMGLVLATTAARRRR